MNNLILPVRKPVNNEKKISPQMDKMRLSDGTSEPKMSLWAESLYKDTPRCDCAVPIIASIEPPKPARPPAKKNELYSAKRFRHLKSSN